jgi:hypothetical protein
VTGYIPFDDAAQTTRVTADGYTIAPWPTWGITYITLNYATPKPAPPSASCTYARPCST